LITRDLITSGVLYPWGYVSCFTMCHPGQEGVYLAKLKRLIALTTPEFQLTGGRVKETAFLSEANSLR
jgi:hypothetical protein